MNADAAVIAALVDHARPVMLKVVRPDSCIAMTRLAVEVLEAFRVAAAPCRATLIAANPRFVELFDAGRIRLDEPLPEWAVADGAYAIGVGFGASESVVGHVVCLTRDFLIDLSIDQASRPERGLVLDPAAMPVSAIETALQDGTDRRLISYRRPDGVQLVYGLFPTEKGFKRSPDWRDFRKRYGAQAAEVVRRMRCDLGQEVG